MLGARDETYKEKGNINRCIYKGKKEVHEQFERKMNQDVNVSRKLFWKEEIKVNGRKIESCSRIKDGKGRLKYKGFGISFLRICII